MSTVIVLDFKGLYNSATNGEMRAWFLTRYFLLYIKQGSDNARNLGDVTNDDQDFKLYPGKRISLIPPLGADL